MKGGRKVLQDLVPILTCHENHTVVHYRLRTKGGLVLGELTPSGYDTPGDGIGVGCIQIEPRLAGPKQTVKS